MSEPVALPWRRRPARATSGFLSPAVRNLVREHGPDVLHSVASGGAGADEIVPFNTIRRRTAAALLVAKGEIPHALAVVDADYAAVDAVRRGAGLTALPFVARAVIDALREFPQMNAVTGEDGVSVVVQRAVHLGIAVDLDFEGLVVPVVRDADGLRLHALGAAIRDLAARARTRRLGPDDLSGGTFTITNPGASGTWISFPVINRPQVGILATDGVSKQVVVDEDDRVRVATVGHLSCAFDHRALDGAYAGAFLARVREIVETRDWSREL